MPVWLAEGGGPEGCLSVDVDAAAFIAAVKVASLCPRLYLGN